MDEKRARARERQEDLAFVAASPQGARFLRRLLMDCGYGQPAPEDGGVALYNFAQALARELARAHPSAFRNITGELYGIF